MTQESYVSFETAKLLKGKGFNEKSRTIYRQNGIAATIGWKASNAKLSEHEFLNECVARPTTEMACAWLRKKGYHIAVLFNSKFRTWERIIQASTGIEWSLGGFSSHDEAVEEGIKYAIEVLI